MQRDLSLQAECAVALKSKRFCAYGPWYTARHTRRYSRRFACIVWTVKRCRLQQLAIVSSVTRTANPKAVDMSPRIIPTSFHFSKFEFSVLNITFQIFLCQHSNLLNSATTFRLRKLEIALKNSHSSKDRAHVLSALNVNIQKDSEIDFKYNFVNFEKASNCKSSWIVSCLWKNQKNWHWNNRLIVDCRVFVVTTMMYFQTWFFEFEFLNSNVD